MSHPYKPQARLDRDFLRHLHRRLACGSSIPTPQPGETYGAWHSRMSQDLGTSQTTNKQEEWRKEHGPWHAHEIKAWMDQLQRAGSESASAVMCLELLDTLHMVLQLAHRKVCPEPWSLFEFWYVNRSRTYAWNVWSHCRCSVYGASGGVPGSLGSYLPVQLWSYKVTYKYLSRSYEG